MFEEKVGINYTILKKYLLELNGPKTYNGKNNKTKDEATWRNVVKKVKWNIQYHASSLDWQFISYMILYVLQCHSPKSSHPLPLPQSPKDCSMLLCLFCCLAYRGMVRGGRRQGRSGWGTRVYLWRIHVDVWQSQYNIVK